MIQDMHERLKKSNERRNCGADEEIASLRAALAAKDAEIERLIFALMAIAIDADNGPQARIARAALVNTAAPEPELETCVWKFTPCGWHQGCSVGTDTLAEVTEYCPDCGKRVEVRG